MRYLSRLPHILFILRDVSWRSGHESFQNETLGEVLITFASLISGRKINAAVTSICACWDWREERGSNTDLCCFDYFIAPCKGLHRGLLLHFITKMWKEMGFAMAWPQQSKCICNFGTGEGWGVGDVDQLGVRLIASSDVPYLELTRDKNSLVPATTKIHFPSRNDLHSHAVGWAYFFPLHSRDHIRPFAPNLSLKGNMWIMGLKMKCQSDFQLFEAQVSLSQNPFALKRKVQAI